MRPPLVSFTIGDDASAWEAAGFAVERDGRCRVGTVDLILAGPDAGRGLRSWAFGSVGDDAPADLEVDGITTATGVEPSSAPAGHHPNGSRSVDHVVVLTPDPPRTTAGLEGLGLDLRRIRPIEQRGVPAEQRFFRAGEVIIEVVGPVTPDGDGPARLWGLVTTVVDLDATAAQLGPALGPVTDAVQPGRRIATVRGRDLGLTVPLAFLSSPPGADTRAGRPPPRP